MVVRRYRQVAKLLKLAQQIGPGGTDVAARAQQCLQRAEELEGGELRDLVRSMARFRRSDERSWQLVASVVTRKVEEIEVETMVRIAGSFSRVSQGNPEMLKAMIMRIKGSDCKLSCWSWADFMLSLQSARIRPDEQLVKAAADAWLTNSDTVKKLKMSYIMAIVKASLSLGQSHRGIILAISERVARRSQNLKPHDLPRVALAFGRAACKDDALMQPLCQAVRQKLPSLPKNRISWTLHGLSLMDCKDRQLLAELATAWASGRPKESIEVVRVFSALAKSGALVLSLCDQMAACSLPFVFKLSARQVARVLHACSQSNCQHVEFLESLGKAARGKLYNFSADELCAVSFAGAKLSLSPILGNCVPSAAVERVSEFKALQLGVMMHAVLRLSSNPGEYLPMIERAVLLHVPRMKSIDLRYVSMAWAKAHTADPRLVDAVASHAVEVVETLDPSTCNHLAWAYSQLRVTNISLFQALGQRCTDTVSSFKTPELAYTALAFVRANVHDETALIRIAAEALTRLGHIQPFSASALVGAFTEADSGSTAISDLLEGLAVLARRKGWTHLETQLKDKRTDVQRQCAETVREFLPSIKVNQRHQMGPVLTMALEQSNGILVNLEVDAVDQELSDLDVVARSRRDEFLETIGVEVLRFKVKNLDDLKYHLLQTFGGPAEMRFQEPADLEGPDFGALHESEVPTLHQSLWKELELEDSQSQSFLYIPRGDKIRRPHSFV